ncbi:hypothetical protein BDP27DRAFT_1409953 [Rhodocollybia butyracea]|uniref:Uncharacterized protein n=1 Tax=Rhodocollybia butyracea TaxID=206335 RepID=A0A9P5P5V7_9AGAR|nr:hypothetical protein BDP27DRAFT_1409953 [Rhodocollybia butyracea]
MATIYALLDTYGAVRGEDFWLWLLGAKSLISIHSFIIIQTPSTRDPKSQGHRAANERRDREHGTRGDLETLKDEKGKDELLDMYVEYFRKGHLSKGLGIHLLKSLSTEDCFKYVAPEEGREEKLGAASRVDES